jgi:multiple sugar transport system permease protein
VIAAARFWSHEHTRRAIGNVLLALLIAAFVVLIVFPFYWMVTTSIKMPRAITKIPPDLFPREIHFNYFVKAFTRYHMAKFVRNSLIISVVTTVVSIVTGGFAGYALARIDIKGKKAILLSILAVSMFPGISVLGPLFLVLRNLGLMNTRPGLVLPYVSFMLPITVWVLTNFFREIPLSLEEAALIDGCTPVQALVRVIAPLSVPGIFTMSILNFVSAWNEFLMAFALTSSAESQTVPIGIMLIIGEYEFPWGEMSAASVAVTVPLIVLVLILQKWVIQGLTAGAIKG